VQRRHPKPQRLLPHRAAQLTERLGHDLERPRQREHAVGGLRAARRLASTSLAPTALAADGFAPGLRLPLASTPTAAAAAAATAVFPTVATFSAFADFADFAALPGLGITRAAGRSRGGTRRRPHRRGAGADLELPVVQLGDRHDAALPRLEDELAEPVEARVALVEVGVDLLHDLLEPV
jgi:hypothetical protein